MGCTESSHPVPDDAYQKITPPLKPPGCFTDNYFTHEQKILVKHSWKQLDNGAVDKGIKIFLRIFEKKPEAKQLFPFRDLEGEELLRNPMFRGHATRFFHAVGSTITNIDALDLCCAPTLISLGRKHIATVKFLEEYMEVFIEAIQHVFEKELGMECGDDLHKAWTAVFQFICDQMLQGYNEALEELNADSGPNNNLSNSPSSQPLLNTNGILHVSHPKTNGIPNGSQPTSSVFSKGVTINENTQHDRNSSEISSPLFPVENQENSLLDISTKNSSDKNLVEGIQSGLVDISKTQSVENSDVEPEEVDVSPKDINTFEAFSDSEIIQSESYNSGNDLSCVASDTSANHTAKPNVQLEASNGKPDVMNESKEEDIQIHSYFKPKDVSIT